MATTDRIIEIEAREAQPEAFVDWPLELQDDLAANELNSSVGSVLVSETENLRVWHVNLPAGARCAFHRHVLDYFWTCHSHGRTRGYYDDGTVIEVDYYPGLTKHFKIGEGAHFTHSVENIGDTDLLFTTVEILNTSANPPLPVNEAVRLNAPA